MHNPDSQSILILDDDVDFCSALAQSLSPRGWNAVVANDIHSALQLAREFQPNRAIVDLRIGNESGLQAVSDLKSILPDIEIIVLTGYSSIATAVEAIKLGAVHYLTKPASISEISAAFGKKAGDPDTEVEPQSPSIKRLEWEHIQQVLTRHNGNLSATARELNMHRRTLQRKLQKYPVKK